jgi:hypothetical protein
LKIKGPHLELGNLGLIQIKDDAGLVRNKKYSLASTKNELELDDYFYSSDSTEVENQYSQWSNSGIWNFFTPRK